MPSYKPVTKHGKHTGIKAWVFCALALLFLLEITSRIFFTLKTGAHFLKPQDMLYTFYPKLKSAGEPGCKDAPQCYDILLLGASTLDKKSGNVEELLLRKLQARTGRKVRIFNLATPAFTSRDSFTMYSRLTDRKFDLVVVYDGINDLRANNCPPFIFKHDYSMYPWYENINILLAHKEINFFTLPFSLHKISAGIREAFAPSSVPTYDPQKRWMKYGCIIKTKAPFKKYTEKIVDLASQKGEAVLLMTFAFYIPDNYTNQQFKDKLLDYGRHTCPVEDWGSPPCVAKGIRIHNDVIRGIAGRYPRTHFVDQEALIPKSGIYFDDVCHLTGRGCEKFVDNIVQAVMRNTGD